jgi:hypothetical protein
MNEFAAFPESNGRVVAVGNPHRIKGPRGCPIRCRSANEPRCTPKIDLDIPKRREQAVTGRLAHYGVHDYPAGSFIHNPAGSAHGPQSKEGCVLFVFLPEG